MSALFDDDDGDVTAVVSNGVSGFGVYSSRKTVRNGGQAPGEVVRWLKDWQTCFTEKGFFSKADFEHLDQILSPKS